MEILIEIEEAQMKTITLEKELIPSTFLRAKYGFVIGIFCFLLINTAYSLLRKVQNNENEKVHLLARR